MDTRQHKVTLKQINARVKQYGYELVHGENYFYFAPIDLTQKMLDDSSVAVFRLGHLSLDQWERELKEKIAAEQEPTDGSILTGTRFVLKP